MLNYERSNLPSLRQVETRSMLGAVSSGSSLFSRSRRSTSSLLSIASDMQSSNSSQKGNKNFKAISYQTERRITGTADVIKKYHTIQKSYKSAITALISEKSQIKISMEREKAHIDTLIQENEEREANIKETLEILRSNNKSHKRSSKPPTIEQLRKLSNTIMREGMKFKKASECQKRIEREIEGLDSLKQDEMTDLAQNLSDDASIDKVMEIQRKKLSDYVYNYENIKLRLETTMANRDMLQRVNFDHNTNKEALKLKMQSLTEEGKTLVVTFEEQLQKYAQILGEIMWKNEVVKACNAIAKLPKSL